MNAFPIEPLKVPLVWCENNQVLRVWGTRISLDLILDEYVSGRQPRSIAMSYQTVKEHEIHAVLAFCAQNESLVKEYLAERLKITESYQRLIESQNPASREIGDRLRARWAAMRLADTIKAGDEAESQETSK